MLVIFCSVNSPMMKYEGSIHNSRDLPLSLPKRYDFLIKGLQVSVRIRLVFGVKE